MTATKNHAPPPTDRAPYMPSGYEMLAYLAVRRDWRQLPNPPPGASTCRAMADINGKIVVQRDLDALLPSCCLFLPGRGGIPSDSHGVRLAIPGGQGEAHYLLTEAGVQRLLDDYLAAVAPMLTRQLVAQQETEFRARADVASAAVAKVVTERMTSFIKSIKRG